MSNKYQIQKAYDKLRRAKDKDILSLVGQTDWKIVNDVIMNRAMFVAPSGEIIAAKSSKGTHDRFPEDLILYVSGLPENEEPTDPFYFEQVIYDLLRDLTRLKGWIRLNGGSNAVEERCYAVLTDWNEGRPTNAQLYVLEDLINMAYDNNREYVIIFFGEGGIDSKTFYFNQYMPEDIMRIVKRYYTSGRIYESFKARRRGLNEGNENYITLYHNTPYRNCKSILKNGLKIDNSTSERVSGWQMTWATDHPVMNDSYGGNIVKFRLPKHYRHEKVNNDQYIILDDIEPELIDSIDYLIGGGGTGYMHLSELDDYINKYGKEKVRKVLTIDHNEAIPLDDIKAMTPKLGWTKNESLNEVYPNKGESKKDFIARFMSATKDEYPDIKQRYAVANAYWDRRDKVNEAYGYHYGDLDVAKKAENRARMSRSRGTGHLGTGFYMVGTFEPEKASGYGERACWEIDLDKYNTFKPRSNSQAYELHDALRELNGGMPTEYPTYEYFQENVFQPLYDKYIEPPIEEVQVFYGVDEDEAEDILWRQEQFVREDDNGDVMVDSNTLKRYLKDLQDELDFYGVLEVLGYDKEYRPLTAAISTEDIDSFWYDRGRLLDDLESLLNRQNERWESLRRAIRDLKDIFYDKDVEKAVEYALQSEEQEDSRSTIFMKSLGYEGVDVTHLNKDGEGLSGLDNFGYGSVIYDLKPGTYRKIKERDAK